jgi:hypothetical protein
MEKGMSRVLGIAVMLVVMLAFSVSTLPRAGPDHENVVEQSYLVLDLNTADNFGTISDLLGELRTTEQVFVISTLSASRSTSVVVRETNGAAQWMYRNPTASGSLAMHRTDNGWRLLTT